MFPIPTAIAANDQLAINKIVFPVRNTNLSSLAQIMKLPTFDFLRKPQ
jgi:hypothetical protein